MEVRDKLYELTNDIDNIGLYDPEKRRKEEEELKIEYHTKLAREEGIEQGAEQRERSIAKNLLEIGISKKDIMKATVLSEKQLSLL